ncbi:MAG: methyltransferase domain-containing protein [Aliifodinibius sp.]|nr:methyltransferase domain-containing protein [Fodinibius sp.]
MYQDLYHKIQKFYDVSSPLWEKVWGEHMHHGYYGPNADEAKSHYQAQVDMMEEFLRWGNVNRAKTILDVGCGIGGSSIYLSRKLDAKVTGITLSPVQATRATQRVAELGMSDRVQFNVADALCPPFSANSFDLVWSLESGEHMPDKQKFIEVCAGMLRPNGKLLLATWCHRPTPPPMSNREIAFLRRLYRAYNLPYIISINEYASIAEQAGFTSVICDDWSTAVSPFWPAVVRSALRWQSIIGLIRAGWPTIRGALAMKLMIQGYRSGLIRFGLLQGTRL